MVSDVKSINVRAYFVNIYSIYIFLGEVCLWVKLIYSEGFKKVRVNSIYLMI